MLQNMKYQRKKVNTQYLIKFMSVLSFELSRSITECILREIHQYYSQRDSNEAEKEVVKNNTRKEKESTSA